MKERIRRLRIWWRAHMLGYRYWRVTYGDIEGDTRLLNYEDAWNLSQCFGGGHKLWIDYSVDLD